jgi:hypothetical protein
MAYMCERCGYKTDLLGNLKNHLKRKNICQPTLNDISQTDLLSNLEIKLEMKKSSSCEHCGKIFSSPQSKYNHKKKCTKIDQSTSEVSLLKEKIAVLEEKLKGKPVNTVNIENQSIQQNFIFNVKNFGCENMDYLSHDFLTSCLITNNIVPLIESIHFDSEHPENHNIKMKSLRYELMEQYVDGKWIVTDKEETLDELINKGYRVLKYHSRKNKQLMIDNNDIDEDEYDDINEWLENLYEDKKTRKPVKRQLLLLFINNKTLLLEKSSCD